MKTVYVKGRTASTFEEKEQHLYMPTFKPLWHPKVSDHTCYCFTLSVSEGSDFISFTAKCALEQKKPCGTLKHNL